LKRKKKGKGEFSVILQSRKKRGREKSLVALLSPERGRK